jgi:lipopolysaccharide export system permease protein
MPPPSNYSEAQKKEWVGTLKYTAINRARDRNSYDAEVHMRPALAVGCLCFVLIGAPVGIWFSRADYLSTFVSCFLPTVIIYYPLLLAGTNMAKDGRLPAAIALWMADGVIGVIALILFARLLRR